MGFWGIEVKSGKPYTYQSDSFRGRLHVTQATLGTGSSIEKTILQCLVEDKSPVFLCSLLPNKNETCPLNLEFEEDGEVLFSVIGPRSIHLSGFQVIDGHDCTGDDSDSDSYGEDIANTESEESSDYDSEEEYDDDFINDDLGMYPPSPVRNSRVVIEEILDDEKPQSEKARPKSSKNKNQSTDRQIVVKGDSGIAMLESEDEDGFPISVSNESKANVDEPQVKAEEKTDQKTLKESKKKRRRNNTDNAGSLDKSADTVIPDDKSERGTNLSEVPETNVKQKKKKQKQSKIENTPEINSEIKSNVLPVADEQDQKLSNENKLGSEVGHSDESQSVEKKKKKKKKKSKEQEGGGDADKQQPVATVGGTKGSSIEEKKTEQKPSHARSFSNGLAIEELAMGRPNGKRASPGKKVSVRYIGKLQKNGSIFDSNIAGPPFKFRLGVGQVIKGWDVGVNGMRVGDKRRLTIPPSMGYGAQGAGKKIPPNSWLVFDVELIDVN